MKILLICLTLVFISCSSNKQIPPISTDSQKLDKYLQFNHKNGMFNGSVIVVKASKVIYKKYIGDENPFTNKPLSAQSQFNIGSLAKPMTALAVLQLVEQKKMHLDDKLNKYFTEFPKYADTITIKHLLNHTSGIVNHYDIGMQIPGMTNHDVLQEIIKHDLLFEPGSQYNYSNSGYILLALIIEKVSKQTFAHYMSEHIFKLAGMNNSVVRDNKTKKIKHKVQAVTKFGKVFNYPFYTVGNGGFYMTIDDLFLWEKTLSSNLLIQQELLQQAFKPTQLNDGTLSNYGLGWHVGKLDANGIAEKQFHTGGSGAFISFLFRDRANKNAVLMVSSHGKSFALNNMADALTAVLYDKPIKYPKIPIAIVLNNLIDTGEENDLQKQFSLMQEQDVDFTINEDDMNELGYYLLSKKDLKHANLIFEFNTQAFPKSFNAYDSYAESFLEMGNIELAKKYYLESFKLNPEIEDPEFELKDLFNEIN